MGWKKQVEINQLNVQTSNSAQYCAVSIGHVLCIKINILINFNLEIRRLIKYLVQIFEKSYLKYCFLHKIQKRILICPLRTESDNQFCEKNINLLAKSFKRIVNYISHFLKPGAEYSTLNNFFVTSIEEF